MGSDSDDDEDDTAGLQAQAATMLAPIAKQQKKQGKKIEKLDILLQQMRRVGEEQLPNLRNENAKTMAEQTVRLESVQAEVATLASKTSLELVREEQSASEQRLRKALDEERSKTAALELVVQGLQSRLDAMERAMRASELKTNSEVSAAVAQLSQLNAALERHKGETEARVASAADHGSLESAVAELKNVVEHKFGQAEAEFALSNKLDKSLGDQMAAEVEAMQQRLTALFERANGVELAMSKADTNVSEARRFVDEIKQDQQELNVKQNDMYGESQTQTSHIQDLIKAIRALTADAEMRAALDEREIEFLWAAPSHIYGSHGWRPNNGSKSERTPYPAGNFKMAVRHGSEGHARDVLAQRRKWLNSITIGQRAAVALENEATAAGTEPDGVPIRLPDIDELKRKGNLSPRSESPMNVLLEPAHKLLSANPPTLGGSVGLTAAPPSGVRSAHPNPSPTRHRTRPPAPDFPDPMTV